MRLQSMTVVVLAVACLAHAPAQAAETVTSFVTVDSVSRHGLTLVITGIKQGESSPAELSLNFIFSEYSSASLWAQSCEKFALLAMSAPGKYVLAVSDDSASFSPPKCKLARAVP